MITGFLTFVIWLIVMAKVVEIYSSKQPPPKILGKTIFAISTVCFSGALLWIYHCHWDWMAVGLFIIFFIYLAIRGLFGPL